MTLSLLITVIIMSMTMMDSLIPTCNIDNQPKYYLDNLIRWKSMKSESLDSEAYCVFMPINESTIDNLYNQNIKSKITTNMLSTEPHSQAWSICKNCGWENGRFLKFSDENT